MFTHLGRIADPTPRGPGKQEGSQYAFTYRDSNGNPLDGAKTYKVNVPANVPAKDFWSFTLYDNQTRSMLQTDAQFPAIGSNDKGVVQNDDGSYDIYFGPTAPKRQRKQLGPNSARQGLEHDLPALRR